MPDIVESTRTLTNTGLNPDQAAAITRVVQQAVDGVDHVTPDQLKAGLAEVRAEIAEVRIEIANVDTRLSTNIAQLDTRLSTSIAQLDTRLSTSIAQLDTRLSTSIAGLSTNIADLRAEISLSETQLIRWIAGIMLTAAGIVAGTSVALGLAVLRALTALAGDPQ